MWSSDSLPTRGITSQRTRLQTFSSSLERTPTTSSDITLLDLDDAFASEHVCVNWMNERDGQMVLEESGAGGEVVIDYDTSVAASGMTVRLSCGSVSITVSLPRDVGNGWLGIMLGEYVGIVRNTADEVDRNRCSEPF